MNFTVPTFFPKVFYGLYGGELFLEGFYENLIHTRMIHGVSLSVLEIWPLLKIENDSPLPPPFLHCNVSRLRTRLLLFFTFRFLTFHVYVSHTRCWSSSLFHHSRITLLRNVCPPHHHTFFFPLFIHCRQNGQWQRLQVKLYGHSTLSPSICIDQLTNDRTNNFSHDPCHFRFSVHEFRGVFITSFEANGDCKTLVINCFFILAGVPLKLLRLARIFWCRKYFNFTRTERERKRERERVCVEY